jgi:transketolase
MKDSQVQFLEGMAARLRIDSVRATTEAGSGHPTSCASAAEIMAVLFFSVMRYDPANPKNPNNDLFVLSKGHAAPILYAAWAEAGLFPVKHLLTLRRLDSDLEGHPTPELPFVEVATGSLGQGLSVAVGMALNAKRLERQQRRIYVLLGDGESAEGAVWEAAQMAAAYQLDNLCATVDINRLGQSQPTLWGHDLDAHRKRWEAQGWQAFIVNGHDVSELLQAYERFTETSGKPTVILARTMKGRGFPSIEDKEGYHGRPLDRDIAQTIISSLERQISPQTQPWKPNLPSANDQVPSIRSAFARQPIRPPYVPGSTAVATRRGFGDALAALAPINPKVVVLDGDVKNSTYTEQFAKAAPERFFECYIAEQNMLGVAMGLASQGKIPFVSTFACFFSRAYDFIRMAAISGLNIKLAGTHAGVSIGEDGASQMGLEDLAMMTAQPGFTVLYPADATSAWRATELLAQHEGPCYLRLGRPNSPVIYSVDESFAIGKCKLLRKSSEDKVLIIAAGVTVHEALRAHEELQRQKIPSRVIDLFSVRPIDQAALVESAKAVGGKVITVEDHYSHGGVGDAVLDALAQERVEVHKLAIGEIPHSGKPDELLNRYGISVASIVRQAKALAG